MNKRKAVEFLQQSPEISVLIIGAGVNGIGTFRDLALQGVDVLLVDRGDFCSGASSASSRMVHGGIRYLENGEFRLVREAVRERNLLIRNAPHVVKPLPTTIPIFKWASGLLNAPLKFLGLLNKPSERGLLVIKIGLLMYDAFTRAQQTVPQHHVWMQNKSLEHFPALSPQILCTATYYDGAMRSPERICVDLILDALDASDVVYAANYLSAAGIEGDRVILHDDETGEEFRVRPSIVVNAAGPWIDLVNGVLGQQTKFIGGTKGSHLVLDNPDLRSAIGENEFFFENYDGRIVLIYPLADKVLLGTTDIPVESPEQVRCSDEEIDYILGMVPRIFPDIPVDRSQVVFVYTGVRPLPASDARTAGQISRDHRIDVIDTKDSGLSYPVLSLIGGKWTSFRAFSEQAADAVMARLRRQRVRSTEHLAIGGGRHYPATFAEWAAEAAQKTGSDIPRLSVLFERYGTRALEYAAPAGEEDLMFTYLPSYSHAEISAIVTLEGVVHLDDLVLRRSLIAPLGQLSREAVVELAEYAGGILGWSADRVAEECGRVEHILEEHHHYRFEIVEPVS